MPIVEYANILGMDISILKSDIFFFVTTICVVAISVLFIIVLLYVISVFRDIKSVSKKAKEEGEEILNDVRELHMAIKEKSGGILSFISSLIGIRNRRRRNKD